jgi:hypothetical protein
MNSAGESREHRQEVQPDVERFIGLAGIPTLVAGENRPVWPDPVWEVSDGPQTNRGGEAFGGWHQAER